MKRFIACCLILVFALSGCAGFKAAVDDPLVEVGTRAETARILSEHPGWTERTIAITQNALDLIDGNALTTLQALQDEISRQIDWDKLLPEEQALLQAFISRIVSHLQASLAKAGVDDPQNYLVSARKVLEWINQTARLKR